YREYRSDCNFSIALWQRVSPVRFTLDRLATALRNPAFVPYLGRKSCPLMLPMHPLVLHGSDVRDAFVQRDRLCRNHQDFLAKHHLMAEPSSLALDGDAGGKAGDRRERRRDQILKRSRWQFALRDEIVRPWLRGSA